MKSIFTIIIVIFLILFCLENIIFFIKTEELAYLIKSFKFSLKTTGIKNTIKLSINAIVNIAKKIIKRPFLNNKNSKSKLAILISGGYGDYLVIANWLEYMKKKIFQPEDNIDVFYHKKSALTIFPLNEPNIKFYPTDEYCCESYSITIFISSFPFIKNRNELMIKNFSPTLQNYLNKLKQFTLENKLECDLHPRLDSLISAKTIIAGKNRLQEPDFYNLLNISENYIYNLPIYEDEDKYLNELKIEKKKYILIHRGWDSSGGNNFHVKAWSLKSCFDLIPQIKQNYPDYKIILIGASRQQLPLSDNNADINLIEKTSIEQVKVLLKYAAVLIDNEGGMVHLRHAVHGGPSIVLFGATSPDLFGYSENINLTSNVCKHWCEWINNDWTSYCLKSRKKEALCMEAITTKDVINALKKII